MGNRISINFKNEGQKSVTLFSHWGGMEFKKEAEKYVEELNEFIKNGSTFKCMPLGRKEPNTVMIDFIRYYTKNIDRITHDLYLGKDAYDGDNSDNGHFEIDLNKK